MNRLINASLKNPDRNIIYIAQSPFMIFWQTFPDLRSLMLFGIGLGCALLQRRGGFKAEGRLGMRFLCYLLGMVMLSMIWYGTGEIMYGQASMVFYALSYMRATLAAAFAAGVVPLIFIRLGLADAANNII